ncbi:MAG: hypothetical protein EHM55_11470 [Acidobacteria bacterium]|nr:MAG: hypothetical protein EHM55_11470 [Acidobacteriota bacterium]
MLAVSNRALTQRFSAYSLICFGFLICAPYAIAAEYFAAPDGRPSYEGTIERPLDLATALSASSPARPGDTIWLRGGTYSGAFRSDLLGTSASPIVVRPYRNERVVLDGVGIVDRWHDVNVLLIRGADAEYWDLEVRDSLSTRSFPDRSTPPRPLGISVYGHRIKLINPIVHDAGNGIGLWNAADSELYGALIFNNGYMDPRPNGHGLYIQNDTGRATRVTNSVSFNNFQMGMHAYGEGGTVDGLTIDQFVAFNNGAPALEGNTYRDANIFVGPRTNPADRILIERSHSYHPPGMGGIGTRLGYTAANRNAVVRNNYFMGGTQPMVLFTWQTLTFEGNNVYSTLRLPGTNYSEVVLLAQNFSQGPYLWRNNTYYDMTTRDAFALSPAPAGYRGNFADWQGATGDVTSQRRQTLPPDRVFVMPNRYEAGRAHVVVHNWSRQGSVTVDLSTSRLAVGQRYEIWDVQNMGGAPVVKGTFSGGTVPVPMNLTAVSKPLGWSGGVSHTLSEFGVFVVKPIIDVASIPPPTVTLTSPVDGQTVTAPANLTLLATASVTSGTIRQVDFYRDGSLVGSDPTQPYSLTLTNLPAGTYTLRAQAVSDLGASGSSASAFVTVTAGPTTPAGTATASFVRTDSTTKGNWKGQYGAQGYSLDHDATNFASYTKVTPSGHSSYLWDGAPTDVRALQRGGTGRVAGTWYGQSFTIDVALTDNQTHQVALYGVDYDSSGSRSQRLEVLDATTGTVLDRRDVSQFNGGQYWIYQIKGAVKFRVTKTAGANGVISALFVDAVGTSQTPAPPPSTSTTKFLRTDTTTQGSWKGAYGAEGYGLARDTIKYPSYGRVTMSGSADWLWSESTAETRALQRAGTGRFAGTWFGSVFNIDVTLTDGQAHQVALYALDWDGGRSQRVEIVDAASGAVLDARTVSNFGGGQYLVYQVRNSVRFRITRTAGANAVISGVFVDAVGSQTATATAATFIQADATTRGNWKGVYGAQGYAVVRDQTALPTAVRLGGNKPSEWTWAESSSELRALQRQQSGRIAATWFGEKFSFDLAFSDGKAHRLALYALDWDSTVRAQDITLTNATTGAVLDRRSLKSFAGGHYYVWQVTGGVTVTVTRTAGPNAVISGLFID